MITRNRVMKETENIPTSREHLLSWKSGWTHNPKKKKKKTFRFICSMKCHGTTNTKQLVSSSKFVPPTTKNSQLSEQIPTREQKIHSSNSSAIEAARMRSVHCNLLISIPWLTNNFFESYAYKEHPLPLIKSGRPDSLHPLPQTRNPQKPPIIKQITR